MSHAVERSARPTHVRLPRTRPPAEPISGWLRHRPMSSRRSSRKLAADEQFAEHVARWCLTHRQVSELLTESKLHRLMDQFVTTSPGLPKETMKQLRESSAAVARERRERKFGGGLRALGWAALFGTVACSAAWLVIARSQPEATSRRNRTERARTGHIGPEDRRHAHASRRRRLGGGCPGAASWSTAASRRSSGAEVGNGEDHLRLRRRSRAARTMRLLAARADGRLSGIGSDHGQRAAAGVFFRHPLAAGRHGRPRHVVRRRGRRSWSDRVARVRRRGALQRAEQAAGRSAERSDPRHGEQCDGIWHEVRPTERHRHERGSSSRG